MVPKANKTIPFNRLASLYAFIGNGIRMILNIINSILLIISPHNINVEAEESHLFFKSNNNPITNPCSIINAYEAQNGLLSLPKANVIM